MLPARRPGLDLLRSAARRHRLSDFRNYLAAFRSARVRQKARSSKAETRCTAEGSPGTGGTEASFGARRTSRQPRPEAGEPQAATTPWPSVWWSSSSCFSSLASCVGPPLCSLGQKILSGCQPGSTGSGNVVSAGTAWRVGLLRGVMVPWASQREGSDHRICPKTKSTTSVADLQRLYLSEAGFGVHVGDEACRVGEAFCRLHPLAVACSTYIKVATGGLGSIEIYRQMGRPVFVSPGRRYYVTDRSATARSPYSRRARLRRGGAIHFAVLSPHPTRLRVRIRTILRRHAGTPRRTARSRRHGDTRCRSATRGGIRSPVEPPAPNSTTCSPSS
jgi:hypothetical protein